LGYVFLAEKDGGTKKAERTRRKTKEKKVSSSTKFIRGKERKTEIVSEKKSQAVLPKEGGEAPNVSAGEEGEGIF